MQCIECAQEEKLDGEISRGEDFVGLRDKLGKAPRYGGGDDIRRQMYDKCITFRIRIRKKLFRNGVTKEGAFAKVTQSEENIQAFAEYVPFGQLPPRQATDLVLIAR